MDIYVSMMKVRFLGSILTSHQNRFPLEHLVTRLYLLDDVFLYDYCTLSVSRGCSQKGSEIFLEAPSPCDKELTENLIKEDRESGEK